MSETETKTSRLKESQWIVICSLWEQGEVTLKELSEKFGITEAALSQGLKRRGIKRGSKAHLLAKEVQAKTQEEQAKMIEEIYNFKKRFLRYGDFLMTSTMNQIMEAKKEGKKLATIKNELETIVVATKVYKTIRNDMYHLYDLYNPDNKPDDDVNFNIGVYSEADIQALREAQEIHRKMTSDDTDEDSEDITDNLIQDLEEDSD